MAAKGAAFGIRHLLEKVDENFAWADPRAGAPPQQPAQRARVAAGPGPPTFWKRWTKTLLGQTRGRVRRRKGKPNGREWPQAKNNSS